MKIDAIEISTDKKQILKYILDRMPLASRVFQFNTSIKDIHLEYVEIKIISYEIISKEKTKNIFRNKVNTKKITMLVNTYNGYSESVIKEPFTQRKYVSKSYIKKCKIPEEYIIENVKNEIMFFMNKKNANINLEKSSLQNINIKEVKSIYKPYWVANFRERKILIDA